MDSTSIAEVCHEANRTYCKIIGDTVRPSWEELSAADKVSVIRGVELVLSHPGITPEESHDAWVKDKTMQGWSYGDVRDDAAKVHPNIRPYSEIPAEQKTKDALFASIVRALAG